MKTVHLLPVLDGALATRVETLARKIWPEYYIPLIGEAQVSYMLEKFQTQKAVGEQIKEGYLYYLIQNDGKTDIGYLSVQPREGGLFLSKLYLLPEARGKGYSHQLSEWLKSFSREQGLTQIILVVHKRNPSVKIYQKLGFRITGPVVTDIGNGFVMDDYRMELVL